MRIRIDSDNAKKVNAARKKNGAEGKPLSAHQEVNKALAQHYSPNWLIVDGVPFKLTKHSDKRGKK